MRARPALPLLALPLLILAGAPARADFAGCVAGLRSHALGQGISAATFDRMMAGVEPDMKIVELMNSQPEFKTPIWDYLATLVDEQKVAEGRAMLRKHAEVLARIESAYGVDRHAVVAVWGVESDFGQIGGRWSLPQALSTAACFGTRRREFFRGELISTMKIVQRGDIAPEKLRGSWAGAFGHTQFIPSTYLRLAVDFDGDGRRDLVDSIPDALASTANYLKKSGWITGARWGYEVRLPAGYAGPSGRTAKQPLESWAGRGITRVDGTALAGLPAAGLLLPAGRNGPAFLVTRNFDAAYAYNAAESYALAISVLSDRLRGGSGIRTPWPTDDRGLSRAERKELQERLIRRGYDVGKPDGAIGALTRAAIKDVEARLGMPQTGRPGGKVFDALR
ncbi:MAG: lytic murein transglycosylase [Hyphomicrobiales bacterium]|uniref:lytic murein transglycosylase n=1 Tax=Rhabdaerophilum calidifontis TaxID=2604328 RepID=UPI0012395F82|nr:lytic murein transglycosylase [Rhabdaerophilum calidifontis]MCA1952388.1 lytic murein transglycosylase [Hyphomicrobiales bacterium]MCA1998269.1 lytic murein transglycosylase [Hyphomicrobiales bacterium]